MNTPSIQSPSGASSKVVERRCIPPERDRMLIVLLVLGAALPYVNTLLNGFVYDDPYQVLQNPYVRSLRYLPKMFTTSVWSFMGTQTNYYRPMMTFGYLVCYRVFGPAAYGFHLANIVLHMAVVCLLFFLTLRMFRDRMLAFVAAAVFAVHPIHTESVAWIGAVTDLELGLLHVLTFWLFLGSARPGGGYSERTHVAMLGSFVLALLSKEQALTVPFLATVYEHFYREDRAQTTRAQKLSRYRPLWLLVIAYIVLRIHFLGAFAPASTFADLTAYQTFLSALALVGRYLWKLLWPLHLCAFYVFHKSVSLLDPRVLIGGCGGMILCGTLFAFLWKNARTASFGLVWLFVTLAPVLNPHWVGTNAFTERYLYLPSVGFCWVVAWGLRYLWVVCSSCRPVWRKALVVALSALATLYVLRIVTRNPDWKNNVDLYTRTLSASPEANSIRDELGKTYQAQMELQAAEREFRQSLEFKSDDAAALNDLGSLYFSMGQPAEAAEFFRRAIRIEPKLGLAHRNLGLADLQLGSPEKAELQLRAAVALAPQDNHSYAALGVLYWHQRRRDRAEGAFKQALSINPFDSEVHLVLGNFYAEGQRTTEAAREYQAVLATDPGNPGAVLGLERLTPRVPAAEPSKP